MGKLGLRAISNRINENVRLSDTELNRPKRDGRILNFKNYLPEPKVAHNNHLTEVKLDAYLAQKAVRFRK